jgi:hypothetical protein
MLRVKSPADVSTGGLTTTAFATLCGIAGMMITGALRVARFFRFELFFLADTPICMVKSTSTTDIAIIDIRTGLTIFASPFASANGPVVFLAVWEILSLRVGAKTQALTTKH